MNDLYISDLVPSPVGSTRKSVIGETLKRNSKSSLKEVHFNRFLEPIIVGVIKNLAN